MIRRVNVVILAGGMGKRMNNPLVPKCATMFLDKPIINHIIDTIRLVNIDLGFRKNYVLPKIITVVGYQKDKILELLPDDVLYAVQEQQLGTGDAMKSCGAILDKVSDSEDIDIIIPGDMPLISKEMIIGILNYHVNKGNTFLIL